MAVQPQSIDYSGEFKRAGELLNQNYIIALPTAIASLVELFLVILPIVAFIVTTIVSLGSMHAAGLPFVGIGLLAVCAGFLGAAIIGVLAHATVIRAAQDALEARPVNLGDAVAVALHRLPALLIATLVIILLLVIPFILSFVLIGIPLIFVVWYLLLFTLPAIVMDGQGGLEAIATSFRITTHRFEPSIVAAIGIWLVMVVAHIVGGVIAHVPILGWLAFFVIGGLAQAYAALVAARFYALLR